MRYGNKENKLGTYIVISIIIHLFIIFFFPFGALRGMADEGGSGSRDFGFIQFVEIQSTSKTNNPESKTQSETIKEVKEEKKEKVEEEKEEKEIEQPQKEKPVNENKISIKENQEPPRIEEEHTEEISEDNQQNNNISETQEVLTSEESELKIEREEKDTQKKEGKSDNSKTKNNEEKVEKAEEKPPPPPPPPTAGELIGLSPRPVYPKYLVSEQKTGEVELNVHVNQDGEVEKVEVLNSSGIETMDRNAVLTIENGWEFNSYHKPYSITINVNYQIDDNGNTKVDVKLQNVNFK